MLKQALLAIVTTAALVASDTKPAATPVAAKDAPVVVADATPAADAPVVVAADAPVVADATPAAPVAAKDAAKKR
jgi:hypothetical protein